MREMSEARIEAHGSKAAILHDPSNIRRYLALVVAAINHTDNLALKVYHGSHKGLVLRLN